MKALSINSYYATEILEGFKTIECRSWHTNHRGDLLVCANSTKNDFCLCGRAACIVQLVDIVPFTEDHLDAALMDEMPEDGRQHYAWILKPLQPVMPVKIKGQLNLFNVDDDLIAKISAIVPDTADNMPGWKISGNVDETEYLQHFLHCISTPAYHNFNKGFGRNDVDMTQFTDYDFANAVFNMTGFEPGDIWETMPKGFKRT